MSGERRCWETYLIDLEALLGWGIFDPTILSSSSNKPTSNTEKAFEEITFRNIEVGT